MWLCWNDKDENWQMVLVAKIANCPKNVWMQLLKNYCGSNTMNSWISSPSLHPYFKKDFRRNGQRTSQGATSDLQAVFDSANNRHAATKSKGGFSVDTYITTSLR